MQVLHFFFFSSAKMTFIVPLSMIQSLKDLPGLVKEQQVVPQYLLDLCDTTKRELSELKMQALHQHLCVLQSAFRNEILQHRVTECVQVIQTLKMALYNNVECSTPPVPAALAVADSFQFEPHTQSFYTHDPFSGGLLLTQYVCPISPSPTDIA